MASRWKQPNEAIFLQTGAIIMMQKTPLILLPFILCILLCLQGFNRESITFSQPEKGVYVVEIDADYFYKNSSVYLSNKLETVEAVAEKTGAKVAINGGFFDPNNEQTISFITVDGVIVADPRQNKSLMENTELQPYMDKILNRSEFRILQCGSGSEAKRISGFAGKQALRNSFMCGKHKKFDIVPHFTPVEEGCMIKYSLQAGPVLLPSLRLEEEFFILKKDDKIVRRSAGALERCARTVIGLKDDKVLLIAISKETGMFLPELTGLVKRLGLEEAMAFDGGSSTSLYVNLSESRFSLVSAGEDAGRKVKSVLLIY